MQRNEQFFGVSRQFQLCFLQLPAAGALWAKKRLQRAASSLGHDDGSNELREKWTALQLIMTAAISPVRD